MKKALQILSILVLVFVSVSCSTFSGINKNEPKPMLLSVSNNRESEEAIPAGEEITFTLESGLPEDVSEDKIEWYLNSEKLDQTGKSITVKTDTGINLRYSVHAEVDTKGFSATSNYSRVIAVSDLKYKDYAKIMYSFIDELQAQYEIEEVPGISLTAYGRDGEIEFNLFEGYASIDDGLKNTEETGHVLGSISKFITAATLFSLMEEEGSTLSIDQPIRAWLSEDDIDPDHTGVVLNKINLDEPISALISHTAGLDDYMSIEFALDMFSAQKKDLIFDIAGLVLNKRLPSYPYKDGWAPYKAFPYIMSDYNPERGKSYSTPGYILLGMIAQKYLDQYHDGMTISQYINENLIGTYTERDILLPPTDEVDFENVGEQHVFDEKLAVLIQYFTDIDPKILQIIGLNKEGKTLYSFDEFFDNTNKYFCETCWTGGGFVSNSNQVAKFVYYTLSNRTEDENFTAARKYMTQGLYDDSFKSLEYSVTRSTMSGTKFYGHGGKSIAISNGVWYTPDKDICFAILCDSNLLESDFYGLFPQLFEVTPDLN